VQASVGGLSQPRRETADPRRNLKLKVKNAKHAAEGGFPQFLAFSFNFSASFLPRATEHQISHQYNLNDFCLQQLFLRNLTGFFDEKTCDPPCLSPAG
jgi:hypothetical protein